MKLIENAEIVVVLDEEGSIELSSDLGEEHFQKEMLRLERAEEAKREQRIHDALQPHERKTPLLPTPESTAKPKKSVLDSLVVRKKFK